MSRRYFEQMLEELELANLSSQYRWYASLNPMCYALPDMQYDFRNVSRLNRQDICAMNYFRQPYWMSQGFAFPNYDPFSLLRRNDKRGFYSRDNNFPREKRANGEKRFYPNRKNENNNFRMDRNGKKMDFMPHYDRRYQNGWRGETSQHYQLSREESRNASRLSFRDASIDTCVEDMLNDQHFQNLKQVFENRNASTNCFNLNENMNQIDGTRANADSSQALNYHKTSEFDWPDLNLKNTQKYPGDTQYPEPSGVMNSYASWYCPEEQQQIVDMLKEVDLRHERQLQRNILLSRGEQPNPDESASHSNSQSADVQQRSSLSSDEDEDSINIILYPESCPGIPEVPAEDIESRYHEKSASDFFDEFQNIFTGSPEKKIINTLTKESLKNTSSSQRYSEDEKKVITEDDKNAVKAVLNFEIADDVSEKNFSECSNIVSSSPKEHYEKILSDQDISLHSDGEISGSIQLSNVNASNAPVMDLFKNTQICAESSKQPMSTSKTSTESTLGTTVADVPTKNSSDNKFSFRTSIPENILDKENKKYINGRNVSKNNKLYQSRTFLKTEKTSFLQTAVRRDSETRIISQQCKSNITNSLEDNMYQDKAIRINNNASMKLFDSDNYVNSNEYIRENEKAPSFSEPLLSKSNGCYYKRISISEIFNSVNSSYEKDFVRLSDKNHVTYLRNQPLKPSHLSPSEHLKQILGIGQKFNSANNSSTNILHKNMKIQQPSLGGVEKATASTNPKLSNISQQNDTATSTKCSSSKILNEVKTTKVVGKEIDKIQQGIRTETVEQNQKGNKNNFVDEYCNEQHNLKKENYLNNRHSQCSDCRRNFQYNNYSQNSKQDSYWKRNKYNSQYESHQFKKYNTKPTEEAKSKCCENTSEQGVHLSETGHLQHTTEVNTKKNNLQENPKLRKQESVKYDKQKKCVKGIEIHEAADSDLLLKEEISQKGTHSLTTPTPETSKAKKKFKKKKQKKRLSDESIDKRSEITSSNISDNKHSSQERNNDLKDTSETHNQIRQLNHSNSKQNISFSKTKNSTGPKDTGNLKLSNADIKRELSQEITEKKNDAIPQKKNTINRTINSRDKLDTKTLSPGEVLENETEDKRSVDERFIIKDESSKKNYFIGRINQFQEKTRYWRRKSNRGNHYPNTNNESNPEALKNNNEHFKATTEDDGKSISKNTELKSNKNQKAGKDSIEYNLTSHQQNKFDNDNKMDRRENTLIANNYKARSKEKTSCVILNCPKSSNNVESNKDNQFLDITKECNNNIVEDKTNRQSDCDKLRSEDTVQSTRCSKAQSEYQTGKDISNNITTSIRKPENDFSRVKENSSNRTTSFQPETYKVEATKSHYSKNIVDVSSNSDDRNYIPVDYFFLSMMSHCRCTKEFRMDQAVGTDHSARKRKLNSDSLKELLNKKKTYSKDFLILFVDENCAYEVQDKGKFRLTTSSKSLIKNSNCSDRRDNFPRKCVLYTIDEVKRLFNFGANNNVDNMKMLTKPYSVSNSFGKRNTESNGGNMLPDALKNIVILVSPLVVDKYLRIKRFSTPYPSSDVFISRQISDFLNHLHSSKSSEDLEKCLQFSLNTLNDGDALHRFLNLLLVLSVIRMKWNPDDIRELLRFVCHNTNIKHKYFRSEKDIFDVEINEILHWWNSLCRYIEDRKK